MENKEITIYELMGLVKNNKAPIKIKYDDVIWIYDKDENDYFSKVQNVFLYDEYIGGIYFSYFNDIVEILEENYEWEDIEELDIEYQYAYKSINIVLNKLIKNQKYLKEKMDNKKDDVLFDYWKDKMESKDD